MATRKNPHQTSLFDLPPAPPQEKCAGSFLESIKSFQAFGSETREEEQDGIPYLINEFWTARQRQSHSIHEISYRACFKAQLPEFFIRRLTSEGEAVYDPFMGRGTTLVQAGLMGRLPVGNDINPLSVLLVRPRLRPPSLARVQERLKEIPWQADLPEEKEELLSFYHPGTLVQIMALRHWLQKREQAGMLDETDDWIRMVAINRLTGHSSGFFSVYTLPPNQAVSVRNQEKINTARNQTPPLRNVAQIIFKKSRTLLSDGYPVPVETAVLGTSSAHATPFVAEGSISLIVTSPPFLDVVNYAEDNWLRCWFAGIDAKEVNISIFRKEALWREFVGACFEEFARVVRPGGHVAFEVGEVRRGRVLLERLVVEAVKGLPFELACVMVNAQNFTKTANCWGVSNNTQGTNTNRIVILRRKTEP